MHIILTGATGTIGASALRQCLASPSVTQLSILSRKPFTLPVGEDLNPHKAEIIIHQDYSSYPSELLQKLNGADGCIWAQGIGQAEVPKE